MATNGLLRIVDYGPYLNGQTPGSPVSSAQMNQNLAIIARMGNTVRLYTVEDNQSYVVYNAAKYGLQVIPSVYLDNPNSNGASDPRPDFPTIMAQNPAIKKELDDLIAVLNDPRTNLANIPFVVIGNEEISHVGGWSEQSIIDAINYVRSQTPAGIKFTTAESAGGQYYINNPQDPTDHHTNLGAAVDVIYANILPYWEGVSISQAVSQVVTEYQELAATYPGKQIVISETGWPSGGSQNGSAVPSLANEQAFLQQWVSTADQLGIPYGVFEGFDEPWKASSIPGNTVDASWGLYNDNGIAKTSVATLLSSPTVVTVSDQTTGVTVNSSATAYSGPVANLDFQYIQITQDNLNITADSPNVFIHSGGGVDAIDVSAVNGINVLDGGTSSNFLVGGSDPNGFDTFFVDDRSPSADIWDTVANFHTGDAATIWGLTSNNFKIDWADNQGAAGYMGLTLHATAPGMPEASLTLSGYTTADLTNGRLATSYGSVNGTDYFYVQGLR